MKNKLILLFILAVFITGCRNPKKKESKSTASADIESNAVIDFTGNYVLPEYFKRSEGYDWVALIASKLSDSTLKISIRSRIDIKKASCTYDAIGFIVNDSVYRVTDKDGVVLFTFNDKQVAVSSESEIALAYPCSGGGRISGTYVKTNEPLDPTQIDPTTFIGSLRWGGMGYFINSRVEKGSHELHVITYGMKNDIPETVRVIDGYSIEKVETGDLDADGFPELAIIFSPKENKIRSLLVYSPNNGKSLSEASFPSIEGDLKNNQGFYRDNEFAVVENTLVQIFKLYEESGHDMKPTGKTRQIQYKLVKGEAAKQFVADKALEY